MKVTITNESKNYLTVNEYEKAKALVKQMKDDDQSAAEAAEYAARAILRSTRYSQYADYFSGILAASAEICRDSSTPWDYHGDGFGFLNVWINATAETADGFLKFGCLLSDIYSLDGETETSDALVNHAYIRYFTEKKN